MRVIYTVILDIAIFKYVDVSNTLYVLYLCAHKTRRLKRFV